MIRRHPVKSLTLALLALVLALAFAYVARPTYAVAPPIATQPGDSLVVVGVGGLSWSDVSAADTPVLWGLLRDGSTANVSVKAMGETTCPTDGWATLGAGEAAGSGPETEAGTGAGTVTSPPGCGPLPDVSGDASSGFRVSGFEAIAQASLDGPYRARLGLLGDAFAQTDRCIQAVGPGAALAAATADGLVSHYAPLQVGTLLSDLATCPVSLVDIGALTVDPGAQLSPATPAGQASQASQASQVATLDQRLGQVLRAAPTGADVILVGISDDETSASSNGSGAGRSGEPGLRVLAATGPHYPPGTFESTSTRVEGLAQLSDVSATILERGGAHPVTDLGGRPLTVHPTKNNSEATALAKQTALTDLESRTAAMRVVVAPFLVLWLGGVALLLAVLAFSWRRARPWNVRLTRSRVLRLVNVVTRLTAAMPAATFLANLLPWWRWSSTTWVLVLILIVIVAVISLLLAEISRRGPWVGSALGPMAATAAITVAVIGIDLMTGSTLQTASIFGLQPLVGGRFYGMGNVAFAIYAPAVLLLIAALAHGLIRRGAPRLALVSTLVIGGAAVAVDVLPAWGADFGGPIALVPALGLLLLAVMGVRPSLRNLGVIVAAAAVILALVAYLDWRRPPEQRSHPGRFVQTLLDGGAWEVVWRKLMQNVDLLVAKPVLLVVVLVVLAGIAAILIRPGALGTAPFARLVAEVPLLRHALIAIAVMAAIGFLTNDSGAAIPPVATIITVPLVMMAVMSFMTIERRRRPGRRRSDRHHA